VAVAIIEVDQMHITGLEEGDRSIRANRRSGGNKLIKEIQRQYGLSLDEGEVAKKSGSHSTAREPKCSP